MSICALITKTTLDFSLDTLTYQSLDNGFVGSSYSWWRLRNKVSMSNRILFIFLGKNHKNIIFRVIVVNSHIFHILNNLHILFRLKCKTVNSFFVVENEINSFAIKELIAKNFDLAKNLGIKGAPSYVVNGIFIPGLVDKEKFTSIIGELRQIAAQAKTSESVGIDKNNLTTDARNDEVGDPEKAANSIEENSNRSN